jgi:hypothetical protein
VELSSHEPLGGGSALLGLVFGANLARASSLIAPVACWRASATAVGGA